MSSSDRPNNAQFITIMDMILIIIISMAIVPLLVLLAAVGNGGVLELQGGEKNEASDPIHHSSGSYLATELFVSPAKEHGALEKLNLFNIMKKRWAGWRRKQIRDRLCL